MPDPAQKEERPSTVQTYNREIGEIAAKVGRARDPASKELTSALSRHVKEEAAEIADFIIRRARR